MSDSKARILIVDDEVSIRTSLSMLLGEMGHPTNTAEDGFSALASMRKQIPDILISDLYMPGMSGFELTSVVRRRFPEVRTVVMSGAFRGNEVPSGVAADAFFQKGSSMGSLLRILQSLTSDGGEMRSCVSFANGPIWIQPSGFDRAIDARITICCPECLRTFSEAGGGLGGEVCETKCAHCRGRIRYSIVPTLDAGPVQNHQEGRSRGSFKTAAGPQYEC